ncbi:MAG: cbb3-type cytochrome oxidase assembly protein CcoS [Chitinophagaceae bacterium]|jgi:cbb3-type cytochrome oxidase maturation protein|nr:cbb3-type cytochrome oxidase assembly protein CcoS [Chitinophagaceae bacterium]
MSVIIILLIASISVAALFLAFFIWSVKSGQYDDESSPPMRMLFDNKPSAPKK